MGVTFLKRGSESQKAADDHKQQRDIRKSTMGKMFRFWLNRNKESRVVFIDGEIDEQGFLVPPRAWEHKHFSGGNNRGPDYYLCPEKNDPQSGARCPLCADGDYPAFNSYFTVIDIPPEPYKTKDGAVHTFARRLFVAPSTVMDKLLKLAQKTGGLAGQAFDISRSDNEKSSRVGDLFIPIERKTPKEWAAQFMEDVLDKQGKPTGQKQTAYRVAEYEKEVVQLTPEELMVLGFGHGHSQSSFKGGGQSSTMGKPAVSPGGHSQAAEDHAEAAENEPDIDDVIG